MSLTKSQWLQKNTFKCVLVEIDYVELGVLKTAYFARGNFRSASTDTPAYTAYRDLIVGGLKFTQTISKVFTGKTSVNLGDIELVSLPETIGLLSKAVAGNQIRIFIGEEQWTKSQFYTLATVISSRVSFSQNSIIVSFRDQSEDLQQPVLTTQTTLGKFIPLALGRVFNCQPVVSNAATHEYQFNREPSQAVTAVKINGDVLNPSDYSVNLTNSTITFSIMPYGQITVDVDGCNTGGFKLTASEIILHLFPNAQIETLPNYALGEFVSDELSKSDLLDKITRSVGAFWLFDEFGVLHVKAFAEPTNTSLIALTNEHNKQFSRQLKTQFPPVKSVDLKYAHNFSVIKNVAGTVYANAELAEQLQNNFSIENKTNANLADFNDAITIEPETSIVTQIDASTEVVRKLSLSNLPRFVYETTQLAVGFNFELGDEVKLNTPGANGNYAIITSRSFDILNESIILEFWQ